MLIFFERTSGAGSSGIMDHLDSIVVVMAANFQLTRVVAVVVAVKDCTPHIGGCCGVIMTKVAATATAITTILLLLFLWNTFMFVEYSNTITGIGFY